MTLILSGIIYGLEARVRHVVTKSLSSAEVEDWNLRVPETSRSAQAGQLRPLGLEGDGKTHPPCT